MTENGAGKYWRKETPETMNGWINREEEMEYTRDQRRKIGTNLQTKQTKEGSKLRSWSNYATGGRRDKIYEGWANMNYNL
jgi:hypothetical protein